MWDINIWKQTYPYHHWSLNRMARGIFYTRQISRHNSLNFHQYVSTSTHVPQVILSDNGTEFKNNLMDQVLKQLGIERIFLAPYHWQSNGKLEVFHKYLKPTLKKFREKDPSNWYKYIKQILASYRVTPNLAPAETPFFLVYGRNPNLTLHQLLEPMQWFIGDSDSGMLNLEAHRPTLAIAKKTLDVNHFKTAQKTMDRTPPSFKIGDRVYFKNKQPENGILNGDLNIGLFKLSMMNMSYTLKTRPLEKCDPVMWRM